MIDVTFSVARANPTVEGGQYGLSSGWHVIRHEVGKDSVPASRVYATTAEAQAEADRLTAQEWAMTG